MKRKFTFLIAAALMLLITSFAWGQTRDEVVAYTLDGTITGGTNGYATESEITQNNLTWMVMGNTTTNPWRIGGKNITDVDRPVYSTGTMSDNITKIVVTHGAASGITINSWTVIVSKTSDFSNPVSTLTPSFAANSTTTINRPDGKDWSNCYYKFVYNVTVFGSSNKFLEFSQAKFYKEDGGGNPSISADNIEIAYNATAGEIAYTINNPVEGGHFDAVPITGGDRFEIGQVSQASQGVVPFTCPENTESTEQTATIELRYTYNNTTVTKEVTITQAAAPQTASIVVEPAAVSVDADAHEEAFTVTYTNVDPDLAEVQLCDENGDDATYNWLIVNFNSETDHDNITCVIDANTGAARTAYFKIYGLDVNGDDVYSDIVTVTQAAGSTPSDQYVRINDLGSLTDGAKVIIAARYDEEHTNGYYAMPGQTSGKPTGVAFTSENSGNYEILPASITDSEDTYYWTVNVTDDGYTFTNANNQMIGWTSSTNFATGGNNTEWTITRETAEETAMVAEYTGFVITNIYTTTTTTTRAFAFNGEKFGPYGTSNMTSATYNFFLDFFVQGATPVVTPSISADDVNIAYNATAGEIAYTINNPVEGGHFDAVPITGGDRFEIGQVSQASQGVVPFTCPENTEATEQTATIELRYTYNNTTVTKEVTITQAAAPTPTYMVNFELNSGTFVPNDDFTSDIVEIEAGTYNLPSATKTGFTFAGWNNGINTYAANAEYTVSDNVEFTAQWTETPAGATYTLITDIDQIVSGKHYIIVGLDEGDAYGIGGQATNNRTGTSVTITSNQITAVGDAKELVINGPTDGKYTIYDAAEPGYLYAASSTKNYLKTQTALDDNGKWTISLTNMGVATITAQGANERNLMRFNPNNGSPLFACYATNSTTGSLPYIYVKDNDTDLEFYNSEVTLGNITLNDEASLTIGSGSVVTVTGTLTNNNSDALIIEDGGQLIHNGNVTATLKKNVAGYNTRSVSGWYTIASPVADMAVSCATTGDYDFFAFNEENTKWLNQKVGANNITNFEQGVGYLYANADATVIDYLGTLIGTETEVTKPLSYACENASYQGINLMGNPFSRNLVAGDIEIAGTPLTTYYTVEGGNELTAKTLASTPIKPGQGFMVQATASSQNLVFNPTSKDRSASKVGYISIVAGNSEFTDNAFVQVGGGNTLHKMTLSDNSSIVYVMNNGNDYAAATIDALEGSMPVCFKANALGSYTITIEAIDINADYLHLIDNFTGEDINLLLEPSYSFIASNGDRAERFTLVFRSNGSEGTTNDIFAYQNNSDIVVNGEGELQVFDVTGRMVATQHVNGVQTVNVPSQGVFIFKLNEKTQKIVVR